VRLLQTAMEIPGLSLGMAIKIWSFAKSDIAASKQAKWAYFDPIRSGAFGVRSI
jgi:hypothetical protein